VTSKCISRKDPVLENNCYRGHWDNWETRHLGWKLDKKYCINVKLPAFDNYTMDIWEYILVPALRWYIQPFYNDTENDTYVLCRENNKAKWQNVKNWWICVKSIQKLFLLTYNLPL
jgi:hypothetical protein